MPENDKREGKTDTCLREALSAAGLADEQLDLITSDPSVAREAAEAFLAAIERRARKEKASAPTGSTGTNDVFNTGHFW